MRSKKKNPSPATATAPLYRAIKVLPPSLPPSTEQPAAPSRPGEAGKAAVTAATLHQLTRYAQDIQDFLEASQMDSLLDQIQSDLDRPRTPPRLRLRRE